MSFRDLFVRKKININTCLMNGECRYLQRQFIKAGIERILICTKCDRIIKNTAKITECVDKQHKIGFGG